MSWMMMPLKRYADFSGRSRRKEYWMFFLGYLVLCAVLGILFFASGGMTEPDASSGAAGMPIMLIVVFGVVGLALFIPSIAVQVRRFHDQDRTGWLVLLAFVPYIGSLIVLVFMCLPGTVGPNRYGPDPKNPHGFDTDVFA